MPSGPSSSSSLSILSTAEITSSKPISSSLSNRNGEISFIATIGDVRLDREPLLETSSIKLPVDDVDGRPDEGEEGKSAGDGGVKGICEGDGVNTGA